MGFHPPIPCAKRVVFFGKRPYRRGGGQVTVRVKSRKGGPFFHGGDRDDRRMAPMGACRLPMH